MPLFHATCGRRPLSGRALAPLVAIGWMLASCGDGSTIPAERSTVPDAVVQAGTGITAATVLAPLSVLADDSMMGRDTPSPGLALSGAYIADYFRHAGLTPNLQRFPCAEVPAADEPSNVMAVLPGSDPQLSKEYVVVSAHYDHVGIARGAADSIMNGADDNASGTVAMMEVARILAGLPTPPARSVLFVAFAGEEWGLVGSEHFVNHPPVPLDRIVADINLDMVGRTDPEMIYLSGDSLSTLGPSARRADGYAPVGFRVDIETIGAYKASDQWAFAVVGVPAILITAGMDRNYYHQARDEVATIDTDKIARAARMALYLTYDVASQEKAPSWTDVGRRIMTGARPYNLLCAYRYRD